MSQDRVALRRWAEGQLEVHTQRRGRIATEAFRTAWDSDPTQAPPSLRIPDMPGHEDRPPSGSPDRWASRFRDGRPPPPAPPPPLTEARIRTLMRYAGIDPDEDPAAAVATLERAISQGDLPELPELNLLYEESRGSTRRSRASTLKPQHLLDQKVGPRSSPARSSPAPLPEPEPEPPPAPVAFRPEPLPIPFRPEPELAPEPPPAPVAAQIKEIPAMPSPGSALTKSQKRRLRKRQAASRYEPGLPDSPPPPPGRFPGGYPANGHAPFPTPDELLPDPDPPPQARPAPLPPQQAQQAPPAPPAPPQATAPAPAATCDHRARLQISPDPTRPPLVLACEIDLVPHLGQPHLLRVPPPSCEGLEMFIGWFSDDDPAAPTGFPEDTP